MQLLQSGMNKNEDNEASTALLVVGGEASTDFAKGLASSKNKCKNDFAKKSSPTSSTSSSSHFHNNKVLIYVVTLIGLIFAFSSNMYGVSAMPRCQPCPGGQCSDPQQECTYGIVTNYCGRRVCAKGPGEVCGSGMFKMLGSCGDGLYCNCGRCIGCSLNTLECYDKTCAKDNRRDDKSVLTNPKPSISLLATFPTITIKNSDSQYHKPFLIIIFSPLAFVHLVLTF